MPEEGLRDDAYHVDNHLCDFSGTTSGLDRSKFSLFVANYGGLSNTLEQHQTKKQYQTKGSKSKIELLDYKLVLAPCNLCIHLLKLRISLQSSPSCHQQNNGPCQCTDSRQKSHGHELQLLTSTEQKTPPMRKWPRLEHLETHDSDQPEQSGKT